MKFDPQVQMLKNIDKLNKMKIMKKDIVKLQKRKQEEIQLKLKRSHRGLSRDNSLINETSTLKA